MSWQVIKVSPEDWVAKFAESAHKIVFKENLPARRHRINYALLVTKDEAVIGYVTVREYDDEAVYWQFGGVIPGYRASMTAVKCIEMALAWQKEHGSKRITVYVENKNLPMLRFFLAYGFLIIGTRTYSGATMVDMVKEFT